MAAIRLLDAVGIVLLTASFALLIATCASTPNTSSSLFTIEAIAESGSMRLSENPAPSIRIDFGLWSYCQTTSMPSARYRNICLGDGGASGYNPSTLIRPIVPNFPPSIQTGGMRDLTLGFVSLAVAAAMAGMGIFSTAAGIFKRNRFKALASLVFTGLSFILTVTTVGCVFSLFQQIKHKIPPSASITNRTSRISSSRATHKLTTRYGPCAWTLVAACALLLLSAAVSTLSWLVEVREDRWRSNDDEIEKQRKGSESKIRVSGSVS